MPNQCVRCNSLYEDGSKEILLGCPCGGRLFFYIKKQHLEEGKVLFSNLSENEKKDIEEDVTEILHMKHEDPDQAVVLDLESIRVMSPGKYEVDLVHLFKRDPLIIKLEEGKYVIDLAQAFKMKEK